MNIKIKNYIKRAAVFLAIIFLFFFISKININNRPKKNQLRLARGNLAAPLKTLKTGSRQGGSRLKDIFYIPDNKKYEKFNRPFVPVPNMRKKNINFFSSGQAVKGNLPGFIKNLKFRGFAKNEAVYAQPALIFIAGKIALMKIGGRKYYVHAGEYLKNMFILKVGLSGISYSDKGKIKHLSF
jgi:hypothetical protein